MVPTAKGRANEVGLLKPIFSRAVEHVHWYANIMSQCVQVRTNGTTKTLDRKRHLLYYATNNFFRR